MSYFTNEYKIINANPSYGSRKVTSGAELNNTTIFSHLASLGLTIEKLAQKIPNNPKDWVLLGALYGDDISLDYTGRFRFGERPLCIGQQTDHKQTYVESEPSCEHGFVIRDIQGENHFLCKECGMRTPGHPQLVTDQHMTTESDKNVIDSFRAGDITFNEAMKITDLTLEEFAELMQEAFQDTQEYIEYHDQDLNHSIQSLPLYSRRISCPKEIEDLFSNIDITSTDLQTISDQKERFLDISRIEHYHNNRIDGCTTIMIGFVDGSQQQVTLSPTYLRTAFNSQVINFSSYTPGEPFSTVHSSPNQPFGDIRWG